jgi:hypothetical protein
MSWREQSASDAYAIVEQILGADELAVTAGLLRVANPVFPTGGADKDNVLGLATKSSSAKERICLRLTPG